MSKIKNFLVAAVFLCVCQLSAQNVWNQVGSGLNHPNINSDGVRSTTSQGKVYAAYMVSNGNVIIKVWDGLSWAQLPSFNFNNVREIHDLEVMNGTVYLSYSLNAFGSNVGQLSNGLWSSVLSSSTSGAVKDLYADGNRLYMVGDFNDTANNVEQVCYLESGTLVDLKTPLIGTLVKNLTTVGKIGNKITIGGMSERDTVPLLTLDSAQATWDANMLFITGYSQGTNVAVDLFTVNQRNYYLEYSSQRSTLGLFEIMGDSIYLRDTYGFAQAGVPKRIVEGGVLDSAYYFVVSAANPAIYASVFQVNTLFSPMSGSSVPAIPSSVSTLNNELYLFTEGLPFNSQLHPNLQNFAYYSVAGFAHLGGKVFFDNNSSCSYDLGERAIPSELLSITGMGQTYNFTSDTAGNYRVLIPAGTYTFNYPINLSRTYANLSSTCNIASSISVGSGQNFQQDIALEHSGVVDALVDIEAYYTHAVYGFNQGYSILVQNPGIDVNGLITVELTIPPTMTLIYAIPQSTSVVGNKHTFTFNGLEMFEEKQITALIKTDLVGNTMGDTLTLSAELKGINGDVAPLNNYDTLDMLVVSAYDPNDKTANAAQIAPATNRLDYRIRFQNTGTSPAIKVTVVDTLDLTLPITAIIMNSASHPYSISVQNNILIWEFDNIMLPDSSIDQLGSQGYISFSAGLNPSLGLGDSILNDAEIYFDYQKPVHTNKAKTVIVQNVSQTEYPLSSLLELYPNPTKDKLFVKWKGNEPQKIQLLDISGKVLRTFEVQHNVPAELSIQDLAAGIYFVKSDISTTKLIVQ